MLADIVRELSQFVNELPPLTQDDGRYTLNGTFVLARDKGPTRDQDIETLDFNGGVTYHYLDGGTNLKTGKALSLMPNANEVHEQIKMRAEELILGGHYELNMPNIGDIGLKVSFPAADLMVRREKERVVALFGLPYREETRTG